MDEIKKRGMIALFMYIGIAISLTITVIFGLSTAFHIINYFIPSSSLNWHGDYRYGILENLPPSISFLLVAFIILCFLSWKVRTIVTDYRETVWYPLCHAVIMIILTASMIAVAVSAALVIGGVLGGDISLGYLFKLLFTIGTGAMVFFYYRGVMRGLWRTHKREEWTFVMSMTSLIIILVITSVSILNPFERPALDKTYDTLEAMKGISEDLHMYHRETGLLPSDVRDTAFLQSDVVHGTYRWEGYLDDEFTYERTEDSSYRLCASFEALPRMTSLPGYPYEQFLVETVGESCFDLDPSDSPYAKIPHRDR